MDRRGFIKGSGVAAAAVVGGGACASVTGNAEKLAYLGGTPVISKDESNAIAERIFTWPIVNDAMRKASDNILSRGKMSGTDVTKEFEKKFAAWNGTKYALACLNGTTALNTAFYAIGIKPPKGSGYSYWPATKRA